MDAADRPVFERAEVIFDALFKSHLARITLSSGAAHGITVMCVWTGACYVQTFATPAQLRALAAALTEAADAAEAE